MLIHLLMIYILAIKEGQQQLYRDIFLNCITITDLTSDRYYVMPFRNVKTFFSRNSVGWFIFGLRSAHSYVKAIQCQLIFTFI